MQRIYTRQRNHKMHINVHIIFIINTVCLLHVSATLVAILREVHYKGRMYRDITEVCEPINRCKLLSRSNVMFDGNLNIIGR
jgi:hypothetical protein